RATRAAGEAASGGTIRSPGGGPHGRAHSPLARPRRVLRALARGLRGGRRRRRRGGGGGGGGSPTGAASGRIIFDRGTFGAIVEAEPNDTVGQAHAVGFIRNGQRLRIAGHAAAGAGQDNFDGFQVRALQRVRVTATLTPAQPAASDFDLSLYDPISMQYLKDFAGPASTKTGVFEAKGVFDLVVRAVSGAGSYVLDLVADVPASPLLEAEPNGLPAEAQVLGEVVVGDAVSLA